MEYDIFISYRREGGYDTAKHLNDLLVRDGYKVSFDIDTLRSGDFDTQLLERIDQCKDFILIVDQHAFDRTLAPNFNPKNDWLRCELAYALKKNKNIVPVFLSGVTGFPTNLPNDVVGVVKKNGPEYNRYHFNAFYEDLKKRFLQSKRKNHTLLLFTILSILLIMGGIWLSIHKRDQIEFFNNSQLANSSEISNDKTDEIDSTKFYWGSFNEKNLFLKGLKRGVLFDSAGKQSNDNLYIYKCGELFKISVGFESQVVEEFIFYATDEDDIMLPLNTDFGVIGYNPASGYDGAFDIYSDNQYIVGQCDLDDDDIDELIVAVRTAGDNIMQDGAGIGINVFKLENGKWKRTAKLNETTNVLPANAKIVKNSIYIYWLRYDEKYTFVGDSFVVDSDFDGRAFTKSDFEK